MMLKTGHGLDSPAWKGSLFALSVWAEAGSQHAAAALLWVCGGSVAEVAAGTAVRNDLRAALSLQHIP